MKERGQRQPGGGRHLAGSVVLGAIAAILLAPEPSSSENQILSNPPRIALATEASVEQAAVGRRDRVDVEAAAPTVGVDDRLLWEIQSAIRDRNSQTAAAALDRWLAQGAEGIDQFLAVLATDRGDLELDSALGAILKRAVVAAGEDPERFAPWKASTIIDQAIGLLGASSGNARVLRRGLSGLARFASPDQLVDLIRHQGGQGDNLFGEANQIDMIRLMQDWSRDPSMVAETELELLIVDPARTPLARARGAEMLLQRNWREHVDKLVDQLDELAVGNHRELFELGTSMRAQLSTFVTYLDPSEHADYLSAVAPDLNVFRSSVTNLDEDEARDLLAIVDRDQLDDTRIACLELQAGTDRAIDAAITLIPALAELPNSSAQACVHRAIALDGGLDPAFNETLAGLFERRDATNDPFWQGLGWNPGKLTDGQIEDAIVPWLFLSQGEQHRTRDLLVAHVQDRFPGRYSNL